MQYPLYVQRDSRSVFRGNFPDFPGAEIAGGSIEELRRNAQHAVEVLYDGSEQLIPGPTYDTSELRALEQDGSDGIWLFVNINMSRVRSNSVGFQICLNAALLEQVSMTARQRQMTRSGFLTLAVMNELTRNL